MSKDLVKLDLSKVDDKDLDMVLVELEKLAEKTPLDYEPHPKQTIFHCEKAKIRLLCGGNRSGKTESGTCEGLFHATGLYPDWYPQELRLNKPNVGRIVVQDYAKGCGEVVEPKIWKWLPKNLVLNTRRTQKGVLEKLYIKHVSGGTSTIDVMTHEQDDEQFEGWSGHWAWFDEPPPREKFIATLRGLIDFEGRSWLTMTPINQPWIYDELLENGDPNVAYMTVDIRDNPHLSEAAIKEFESRLTDEEKEARLHGKFKHLTGRVYKDFDPAVHVIPNDRVKVELRWPKFFVCDPHDRKPHFGIWATVDPLGNIYVIDEIKAKGTLKEFSSQVLLREAMQKDKFIPMEVIRIGDPNKMNTPSAVNGLKFVEEFASHGMHFIVDVNDDIALGHLSVAEKLRFDKTKELSRTNKPRLYFLKDTTKECVSFMQKYVWDDWHGKAADSKDKKEKPKDVFKDFPDCIRYLVMYDPGWYESEADPQPYKFGGTTGYGM